MATVKEKIEKLLMRSPGRVFTVAEIDEKLNLGYSPSNACKQLCEQGTLENVGWGQYRAPHINGKYSKPSDKGTISAEVSTKIEISSAEKGLLVKANGVVRRLDWSDLLVLAAEHGEVISQEC